MASSSRYFSEINELVTKQISLASRNRFVRLKLFKPGQSLASYIYEFDLGMQTEQVFVIKKLDRDFWDEMQES